MIGQRGWAVLGSVVLVAGVTAGCGSSSGPSGDPAPATSQALMAIALGHIAVEPIKVEFYGRGEVGPAGSLGGQANFWDGGFSISVRVMPDTDSSSGCDETVTCVPIKTDTGQATLSWQDGGEDNPGGISVFRRVDGELRSVFMEGYVVSGDPREKSGRPLGPATIDELAAIVADPDFGLTTTEAAVAAGRELAQDTPDGPTLMPGEEPEPARPPSTTPRALAAAVSESLGDGGLRDVIVSGREKTFREPAGRMRDGWGIELTLRGGLKLHVTVLAGTGSFFLQCQPTMSCWKFDGATLAGREGLAGIFRADRDHPVHIWLEGPGVHATTEDYFLTLTGKEEEPQIVLQSALILSTAPGIAQTTTQDFIDKGAELTWFED